MTRLEVPSTGLDRIAAQEKQIKDKAIEEGQPRSTIFDRIDGKKNASALALATFDAADKEKDRATRAIVVRSKTGYPEQLVNANLEAFERVLREKELNPQQFSRTNRFVSEWLVENRDRIPAFREDFRNLGFIEQNLKALKGFRRGRKLQERGRIGAKAIANLDTPSDRARLIEIDKLLQDTPNGSSFAARILFPAAEMVGQMFDSIIEGKDAVITGTVAGAVIGAKAALVGGQLGPQVAAPEEIITVPAGAVAGGISGFGIGLTAAFARESSISAGGNMYLDMQQLQNDKGELSSRGRKGQVFGLIP